MSVGNLFVKGSGGLDSDSDNLIRYYIVRASHGVGVVVPPRQ